MKPTACLLLLAVTTTTLANQPKQLLGDINAAFSAGSILIYRREFSHAAASGGYQLIVSADGTVIYESLCDVRGSVFLKDKLDRKRMRELLSAMQEADPPFMTLAPKNHVPLNLSQCTEDQREVYLTLGASGDAVYARSGTGSGFKPWDSLASKIDSILKMSNFIQNNNPLDGKSIRSLLNEHTVVTRASYGMAGGAQTTVFGDGTVVVEETRMGSGRDVSIGHMSVNYVTRLLTLLRDWYPHFYEPNDRQGLSGVTIAGCRVVFDAGATNLELQVGNERRELRIRYGCDNPALALDAAIASTIIQASVVLE